MKTKELFIKEIIKEIKASYQEQISVSYDQKGDQIAFTIRRGGNAAFASCSADAVYKVYLSGEDMDSLVKQIIHLINSHCDAALNVTENISEYGIMKERLIVRAIPYDEKALKDYVWKKNGDIALVLYGCLYDKNNELITFKIPKESVQTWQMNLLEVFDTAMKNTLVKFPPRAFRSECLENLDYLGEEFMLTTFPFPDYDQTPISNMQNLNGAVSVFLPGVAKRISESIGGDFYIANTSIHESMIYDVKTSSLDNIYRNLLDVTAKYLQAGIIEPREILSLSIYQYHADTGRIEVAKQYVPSKTK